MRAILKASWTKRLALGGGALALFLGTLAVGNFFIEPEKALTRRMVGHDFLAFYTAGMFVREGKLDKLYDLDAVKAFEHQVMERESLEVGNKDAFGPWWNPPFYAWVFVLLAAMPYPTAVAVWIAVNMVALAGALLMLGKILAEGSKWRVGLLVPLLVLTSMPFIQALTHGQNTFSSLLIMVVTVALWRKGKAFWAGMVGGLLFYKPQLGAVVAIVMIIDLGWKALAGLAVTGLVLLGITVGTLPGTLMDYLHRLGANVRSLQVEKEYLWERHVTLKAFWRLLFQGRGAGEVGMMVQVMWWGTWGATMVALGMLVGIGLCRKRKSETRNPNNESMTNGPMGNGQWAMGNYRDRLIAATIVAMPLLMPFYFDYDLLLLAIPAVLYGRERLLGGPAGRVDRWLPRVWCLLYLWLYFNPPLAGRCHVNVTVILLSAVAAMMIGRTYENTGIATGCDSSGNRGVHSGLRERQV